MAKNKRRKNKNQKKQNVQPASETSTSPPPVINQEPSEIDAKEDHSIQKDTKNADSETPQKDDTDDSRSQQPVPALDMDKLQLATTPKRSLQLSADRDQAKPDFFSELARPKQPLAKRTPPSAASHPLKRHTPTRPSTDSMVTPLKPSQRRALQESVDLLDEADTNEIALKNEESAESTEAASAQISSARKQLSSIRNGIETAEESFNKQRIVQLENELGSTIKTLDIILSEKAVLEKVVKVKDAALVKTTLDLDDSGRTIEKLKEELKLKDLKIQELTKINDTLSEVSVIKSMSGSRSSSSGKRSARNEKSSAMLPEDSLDRIVLLENTLKVRDQKISALETEVNTLQQLANRRDKYIDELNKEIVDLKFKQDKAFELEGRNNELSLTIDKLMKEIRTLTTVQKTKNDTIEKLSEHIESLKDTNEENAVLRNQAVAKDKRISELQQELELANKTLDLKEQEIHRLINESDSLIPIRSLEGDKRFLTTKVKKLQDKIDEQKRTIAWQTGQIERLTQRMNNVVTALKETKIDKLLRKRRLDGQQQQQQQQQDEGDVSKQPLENDVDESTVPLELFDLLQAEVQELRRQLRENESVTVDKDIVIETLERKVAVLERSRGSDMRQARAKMQQLEDEITMLKNQLKTAEMEHKQREIELKKDLYGAKRRLHKPVNHTARP